MPSRKLTDKSPDYQQGFADGYRAAMEVAKPREIKLPADLDLEAWDAWTSYRRALGKRPYKTAGPAKFLAQYPPRVQHQIVQRSIAHEWQGLFPPDEKGKQVAMAPPEELL